MAIDVEIRHKVACAETAGADVDIDSEVRIQGKPLSFVGAYIVIIDHLKVMGLFYANFRIRNVQHYSRFCK